jgi:hypothetical protein
VPEREGLVPIGVYHGHAVTKSSKVGSKAGSDGGFSAAAL